MPNCEIMSGGVKNAEKTRIPKKKYFLLFFNNLTFKILSLVRTINKIGNSKDKPLAKSKNIINLIYSEYLDSNSKLNPEEKKLSKEIKKFHIIGIKTKYAKITPRKNKKGIRKKIGKKNFFSFLYIAGEINKTI